MEISVGVLDHYNVSTRKLKETVQFYEDRFATERSDQEGREDGYAAPRLRDSSAELARELLTGGQHSALRLNV